MKINKNEVLKISLTLASILVVAVLGSIFVNLGMEWYETLIKPSQWINNIVIPIVWTVIYLTFAIILSIWISKDYNIPKIITVLLIMNGVFNVLWCFIFFTLRLTFLGNVVIILNLILSYWLIFEIKKVKPTYALILNIYPIWISIATTLNTAIWILN